MATLLIVHHTVSPATEQMLEAAREGATQEGIEGVAVQVAPALSTGPAPVLEADAYLLLTPANMGYMSGALKHFFDTIYYPCREATAGRPYALAVHGNQDCEGALRSVAAIATGLGWKVAGDPVTVRAEPTPADLEAIRELAGMLAASLMQ